MNYLSIFTYFKKPDPTSVKSGIKCPSLLTLWDGCKQPNALYTPMPTHIHIHV